MSGLLLPCARWCRAQCAYITHTFLLELTHSSLSINYVPACMQAFMFASSNLNLALLINSSPQRPGSADPDADIAARRGKRSLISRGLSSFTRKAPGAPASPQAAKASPQSP